MSNPKYTSTLEKSQESASIEDTFDLLSDSQIEAMMIQESENKPIEWNLDDMDEYDISYLSLVLHLSDPYYDYFEELSLSF